MNSLPDELLLKICLKKYFSGYCEKRLFMRLVCKRWLCLWERCSENKIAVECVRVSLRAEVNNFCMAVIVRERWMGLRSKKIYCEYNSEAVWRLMSLVYLGGKGVSLRL
ncbi:unnamed protein product [Enterobius vermicularis]|uniref:F-box domain-containing protein n=1 Tax=Enterobius vermicularis TaxID=51028 RepID=A0A0N4VNW0_ENTVE|nr:unnamed protein product [Enterobius vermicularis]